MDTDKSANLRDATKSFIVTGDGNVFNVQFAQDAPDDKKQPIDEPKSVSGFRKEQAPFYFRRVFIILSCLIIVASLIMFFIEKYYVFSAAGVPVKCYASTPSGYEEVPCNWNVHRVFGTPVIRDPEKIRAVVTSGWMAKQDKPPTSKKIIPTADIAFFSPGGEPILWYYQHLTANWTFLQNRVFILNSGSCFRRSTLRLHHWQCVICKREKAI